MYWHYHQCWWVLFPLLLYSLSMSSLGCKALCIIQSFPFSGPFVELLMSILRMVPSILQRGQLRCLSLWWDFCYVVRFRVVFSFFRDIIIYFFLFHFRLFDGVRFQFSQEFVGSFSASVLIFSWSSSSIRSVICRFSLLIISIAHFSVPNSTPISSLYVHIACIRVPSSADYVY